MHGVIIFKQRQSNVTFNFLFHTIHIFWFLFNAKRSQQLFRSPSWRMATRWYFLINRTLNAHHTCVRNVIIACNRVALLSTLYYCRLGQRLFITFAIFNVFSSPCSPSVITAGHFASALPFNESFRCLVDNRMNEWLSVFAAATAYPIR